MGAPRGIAPAFLEREVATARGAQAKRAAQAVAREHPVARRAGVEMHEARARVPADAAPLHRARGIGRVLQAARDGEVDGAPLHVRAALERSEARGRDPGLRLRRSIAGEQHGFLRAGRGEDVGEEIQERRVHRRHARDVPVAHEMRELAKRARVMARLVAERPVEALAIVGAHEREPAGGDGSRRGGGPRRGAGEQRGRAGKQAAPAMDGA